MNLIFVSPCFCTDGRGFRRGQMLAAFSEIERQLVLFAIAKLLLLMAPSDEGAMRMAVVLHRQKALGAEVTLHHSATFCTVPNRASHYRSARGRFLKTLPSRLYHILRGSSKKK